MVSQVSALASMERTIPERWGRRAFITSRRSKIGGAKIQEAHDRKSVCQLTAAFFTRSKHSDLRKRSINARRRDERMTGLRSRLRTA